MPRARRHGNRTFPPLKNTLDHTPILQADWALRGESFRGGVSLKKAKNSIRNKHFSFFFRFNYAAFRLFRGIFSLFWIFRGVNDFQRSTHSGTLLVVEVPSNQDMLCLDLGCLRIAFCYPQSHQFEVPPIQRFQGSVPRFLLVPCSHVGGNTRCPSLRVGHKRPLRKPNRGHIEGALLPCFRTIGPNKLNDIMEAFAHAYLLSTIFEAKPMNVFLCAILGGFCQQKSHLYALLLLIIIFIYQKGCSFPHINNELLFSSYYPSGSRTLLGVIYGRVQH